MQMTHEAEAIWLRILIQLGMMQIDIAAAKLHTAGTGANV